MRSTPLAWPDSTILDFIIAANKYMDYFLTIDGENASVKKKVARECR
jgi:hypothetical protein